MGKSCITTGGYDIMAKALAQRINGMYVEYTNLPQIPQYYDDKSRTTQYYRRLNGDASGYARVGLLCAPSIHEGTITFTGMVQPADCLGAPPIDGATRFYAAALVRIEAADNIYGDKLIATAALKDKQGMPTSIAKQANVGVVIQFSINIGDFNG